MEQVKTRVWSWFKQFSVRKSVKPFQLFPPRSAAVSGNGTAMSPHSLHLTPYTLHPAPCTPQPTTYTLHSTPYTLHPTPYTLGPKLAYSTRTKRCCKFHVNTGVCQSGQISENCYKNAFILILKIEMCSEFHCQNIFNEIVAKISYIKFSTKVS